MQYRLVILAGALVLAGIGLWLATVHASSYLAIMNADDRMGRVVQFENGVPRLYFCDGTTCRLYSEVQRQYIGYFTTDAIIFAASTGLVGLLLVWRRCIQAKSVV